MNAKNIIMLLIVVVAGGALGYAVGYAVFNGDISNPISKETANTQEEDNSAQVSPQTQTSYADLFADVPKDVVQDPEYNACVVQSVDSCGSVMVNRAEGARCDGFLLPASRSACENSLRTQEAVASGNAQLCQGNPTCVSEVVTQQALAAEDLALCESLNDQDATSCNDRVAQELARTSLDESYCALLKEEFLQEFCIQDIQIQKEFQAELERDE